MGRPIKKIRAYHQHGRSPLTLADGHFEMAGRYDMAGRVVDLFLSAVSFADGKRDPNRRGQTLLEKGDFSSFLVRRR